MDWTGFMNGFPTVVQAVILLIVAWIAASICRSIVKKILGKVFAGKADSLSEDTKSGYDKTVSLLGNLAFAVVFFLFLPGALEKLGLSSVTAPLTSMEIGTQFWRKKEEIK